MHVLIELSIIPVALSIVCLLLRSSRICGAITVFGSWIQVLITAAIAFPVFAPGAPSVSIVDGFLLNRLAAAFLFLTSVVCACSLGQAQLFFQREAAGNTAPPQVHVRHFYCFSALFLLSMQFVFLCNNLGYLWISIEATTLLSAGLVYFARTKHAIEATWKYVIICSVGIAFALLGTVFLFAASRYDTALANGTLDISELIRLGSHLQHDLTRLGFVFCFLGYATKAGVFPLHSWLPDAHSEAPAPASAMLSGSLLNCALFAIYRIYQIASVAHQGFFATDVITWSGTITVFAASIFLVRQHGLKRLWAYSSVENVGLMLVAIGIGSGPLFFLQALNHSIAKVSLFLTSGNIIQMTGTKNISDIRGIWTAAPLWGTLFALSALAVTGIPPFGAFIPEWIILLQAASRQFWIQFGLIMFALTLTFIAVMFHAGRVLFGTPRKGIECVQPLSVSLIPLGLVCLSLLLGLTITPAFLGLQQ